MTPSPCDEQLESETPSARQGTTPQILNPHGDSQPSRLLRVLAALLVLIGLPVWTFLLLHPNPASEVVRVDSFSGWTYFLTSKTAHATAYAVLAIGLGFALSPHRRSLFLGLTFLCVHGVATEIIQNYTGRHGCVRDVVIDWFGTGLGLFAGRRVWRPLWRREMN